MNPERIIRRLWHPAPVSEADREWWLSFRAYFSELTGRERSPLQIRADEERGEKMVFPENHPAFDQIYIDRTEHTWVRHPHSRYRSDYRFSSIRLPHQWTLDVFSPAGEWLTTLKLPQSLEMNEIGEDYILGVWKDEMDVEYVRMYSLDRGG
jgi:hypothetical protein